MNTETQEQQFNAVAVNDLTYITGGDIYSVLNIFKTEECGTGYCIVIRNDRNDISGFDLSHFRLIQDYSIKIKNKKP